MSQLQVPTKGPRKRASTEAVRECITRRMRLAPTEREIADLPNEIEVANASEKEMDMSEMMAEIKENSKARLKAEKQAIEDGRRVEKKPRVIIRRQCCGCGEMSGLTSDGETRCCKHICATCF